VGAVYIDPSEAQVVRMSLSFTRAAFLDQALEELSVVLENRLVGGRFWLPSQQKIEIRRMGTWLDYPIRGIIKGRWEIGDYRFNLGLPAVMFTGPEIVQSTPAQLKAFVWKGAILDSLPPEVRAVTDADVQRVQAEARELVRAQALARAQHVSLSARNISDFVRYDRVEGLAVGEGLSKRFGHGISAAGRARYGLDDRVFKGSGALTWQSRGGLGLRVFGLSDFRDAGEEAERSGVVNTVAAQEFGSDYTDYYRVRGGGLGADFSLFGNLRWQLDAAIEQQDSLGVHARPVVGVFEPTLPALSRRVFATALRVDRPPSLSFLGTEVAVHAEARAIWRLRSAVISGTAATTARASILADIERPFGVHRFVSHTILANVVGTGAIASQDLVYLGGPVTGPGYDYHSIIARAAASQRIEWQTPMPFPGFSLGRFGRVSNTGTFAPYVNAAIAGNRAYPSIWGGVPHAVQSVATGRCSRRRPRRTLDVQRRREPRSSGEFSDAAFERACRQCESDDRSLKAPYRDAWLRDLRSQRCTRRQSTSRCCRADSDSPSPISPSRQRRPLRWCRKNGRDVFTSCHCRRRRRSC
jgi:hypothetical protein